MFRKKPFTLKSCISSNTLVFLDIDDCLIFNADCFTPSHEGLPEINFNLTLMQVLQEMGITKVTLVSSMKLGLLATPALRMQISGGNKTRLDLIQKLQEYNIAISKIVSNYDMAINPINGKQYQLGQYYRTHIQPYEALIQKVPATDLTDNPHYRKQIEWQEKNALKRLYSIEALKIEKTACRDNKTNIKHALFDRIFSSLTSSDRILFLDDKQDYLTATHEMAAKHRLSGNLRTHLIKCCNYDARGVANADSKIVLSDFFRTNARFETVKVQSNAIKVTVLCRPETLEKILYEAIQRRAHTAYHAMSVHGGGGVETHQVPIQFMRFNPITDMKPRAPRAGKFASNILLLLIKANEIRSAQQELLFYLLKLKDQQLILKIVIIGTQADKFRDWINTKTGYPLLATSAVKESIPLGDLQDVVLTDFNTGICRDLVKTALFYQTSHDASLPSSGKMLPNIKLQDIYEPLNVDMGVKRAGVVTH